MSGQSARWALIVLAILGCGDARDVRDARPAAAPEARRPAATERAVDRAPSVRIRREADGRLRVRARRAARFQVLQELARVEGFSVSPGIGSPPPRQLDLDLEGASAEDVLAEILRDVPHHLHYTPREDAGGEVALLRVTVGVVETASTSGRAPERESERSELSARSPAPADDEELFAELPELLAAMTDAADPGTRAQAARALGEVDAGEDAFRAAGALVAALSDRDALVVAAAIAALEQLHDVIPDPAQVKAIRALRDHPDARVRQAAASFLDWTEDDR